MGATLKDLYNALKADGRFSETKDFGTFAKKMNERGYSSMVYNTVRNAGADVPDIATFRKNLGVHVWKQGEGKQNVKPTSAVGKEAQSVEQERWGGTASAAANEETPWGQGRSPLLPNDDTSEDVHYPNIDEKSSALVRGMALSYVADQANKPTSYTKPGALVEMEKSRQKKNGDIFEQTGREYATEEYDRQNAPAFMTGANVGDSMMKRQGQLEKELAESANLVVGDKSVSDYLSNAIFGEFKNADKRALQISQGMTGAGTPGSEMGLGIARSMLENQQKDPEKLLKNLQKKTKASMAALFSDPNMTAQIEQEAKRLGVPVDHYIQSALAPKLQERLSEEFDKAQLERYLPKGTTEYVLSGINDSLTGTLIQMATMNKKQREYMQRANAMTAEGLNPNVEKPGMWTNAARGAVSFAADAPIFKLLNPIGGMVAAKMFGNGVAQMARAANMSWYGRMGLMAGQGAVSQGTTGLIYGGLNSAVQNYSTGEDTSLANTARVALGGALSEGASWATMGGFGGLVGGGLYKAGLKGNSKNLFWNGAAKVGSDVLKIGAEGVGMHLGGNVANVVRGEDTNWFSTEGILEDCANVVALKLSHAHKFLGKAAGIGREKGEDGKKESYKAFVLRNLANYFMSDAAKGARFKFTEEEKKELFGVEYAPERNKALIGNDKDGNAEYRLEGLVHWALRTKDKKPTDRDKAYDDTDVAIKSVYERIMSDENISWDTKAKYNALVMGTMPSVRPMMDYCTVVSNGDKKTIEERAKDGTLLSRTTFDTAEAREAMIFRLRQNKEMQRFRNAYSGLLLKDIDNKDIQEEYMRSLGYDFENPNNPRNKVIEESMSKARADYENGARTEGANNIYKGWIDFAFERGALRETEKTFVEEKGISPLDLNKIRSKEPWERTDEEHQIMVDYRRALESKLFSENTVHEEQSQQRGKDVAEENDLGSETPNNDAVKSTLAELTQAEHGLQELMDSNEVFASEYKRLKEQGLSNAQIYQELINSGMTQEELTPFAKYINANAKAQGMVQGTQQKIEDTASKRVSDWGYNGTLNGEKHSGENMVYVTDDKGRTLVVASGDVAFDAEGNAKEGVGDMLVVYDVATGEMDFVSARDVKFHSTESAEDYKNRFIQHLQDLNSQAYVEAQQEQQGENNGKPQQENPQTKATAEENNIDSAGEIKIGNEKVLLSDEVDDNGKQFVLTHEGKLVFGEVEKESNLPSAPILLSEGMITNPSTKDGYGLVHIEARHGDQIRKAGYKSVLDFIENVAKNYEVIKEGNMRDGHKTYRLQLTDKHNNTLMIELSSDGSYWNINTAGIFKTSYGKKNKEVYNRHTTEKQSAETAGTSQNAEQSGTQASSRMNVPTSSLHKDSNSSSEGDGNKQTLTFSDGTPVPMTVDSKGRPTADYSKMTAEQGAEWLSSQFGDKSEAVVDGKIERAKKELAKAEKIKVDYLGDEADIMEAEAKKSAAMEAAKKELALYTDIKKALVEKKVSAAMEVAKNDDGDASENSAGLSRAREKFEKGQHVVGNKRTRTLNDGSKLKGHYELVEAESLTPSHDANNGYRKNEDFPVNEEGRTVNDRDYETDKDAQLFTDETARHYNGKALDNVPVVTKDGIVVDGNGRTMAGQKAAKDGTDGVYIEALKEDAESFGFMAEQIDGMKHPRLVFVADEPMTYDTATFAKFNKDDKKSQNNTHQAIANTKKLSADEVSAIVAEIEGSGSLDAFFNNPSTINNLLKRLIDKGVIGLNEVAGLREGENKLSATGKDFVKNLLLGSVFSEDTIRMMGEDAGLKNKALNGIRAVLSNMKLGEYALGEEIDKAMQLMYEARQMGGSVDALLRTPSMFGENAADKYDPISQAIAIALDGKAEDFRELMSAYNRNAQHYTEKNQLEIFGERPTKEEFINEFLKLRNWKNYETRHSDKEGAGDVGGTERSEQEARGGNEAETQEQVSEAVKNVATEITKRVGEDLVVTDEKESQSALEEAEATDSDVKYHKETDAETLERLEKEPKEKVYRAMQVIDGKLYPPMAAAVDGKLVEANELGVWIRADENPDLAIPDVDPKTGKQKVDPKTGELKWKFKLDKGGKDATGKKATSVNAAYNPYWHTSRSPLNDQFKSAWIRPNIVIVECEVPESELTSGYKAERAKDAVGEVDWKSGSVSGEIYKQTGRARKVILSRWCKPVRVLSDAEFAQKAKEYIGDADVEIPENVVTPKQRVELEKLGVKIGSPEKGVNKSEQIAEALGKGLLVDNSLNEAGVAKRMEFRTKSGEVYGFTDGKKIYLDTKKMKPETPLHEYTHLWGAALRRVNAKEWENVRGLLDKVDGLKEEIQKLYPELKGDDLYDEMLAMFSGREGTKKLEADAKRLAAEEGKTLTESVKAKTFVGKVKEALQRYWKGVADLLHIHFTSAEKVADKVLADWAKGVNPNEARGIIEKADSKAQADKREVALRDAVVERLREGGMDVSMDTEKGQRVLDEVNGKVRSMSFGEPYDYETYPLGRVEPNLAEKEVGVVKAEANHGFSNYKEAKAWAKEHVAKIYNNEETGGKGDVRISNGAIDKFLSQSAVDKSDSKDVHMAVLKVLPDVLKTSLDVETHPDFQKGENGKRSAENGINKDVLVHRCYGAVSIDGKPYRVKITLKENVRTRETTHTHSYEATKIELLAGQHGDVTMTSPRNSNNSISAAKLLENVGMSYNPSEKVLDESEKRSEIVREQRVYHGSGADFDRFDHSHMGEGEGAQAYGWGTYVTEVEGIGRTYAEQNSKKFDNPVVRKMVARMQDMMAEGKTFEEAKSEALERMRAAYEKVKGRDGYESFTADYEKLKGMTESEFQNRHLYTVEIPDDTGENYLDWDKPLTNGQIDAVREYLKANYRKQKLEDFDASIAEVTDAPNAAEVNAWTRRGENVYKTLTSLLGSDKEASKALSEIGLAGIKYPADFMRGGREDGKQNYVIFNEGDARITDHVRFFRTADGEAYGYTIGGRIYIDPRIANSETPIHEYAHLWATVLRNGNAEEWKNVVELMKDTKVWDEVKKRYPELESEDDIADEVLAMYSGRRGAERLRGEMDSADGKAKGALERVKQALQKFWKATADMLHIHYTTAEEVADRVMKDLLDGVDPRKFSDDSGSRETSSYRKIADPMKSMERAAEAYREEQRLKLQKKDGEEDEMFVSLQNKKGKEYYDTVSNFARKRLAEKTSVGEGLLFRTDGKQAVQGERGQRNARERQKNGGLLQESIRIIARERRRAMEESESSDERRGFERNRAMSVGSGNDRTLRLSESIGKEIDQKSVEWAQANNMFIKEDDIRIESFGGKMFGKGNEAHVYLSKDGKTVKKFVRLNTHNNGGLEEYMNFVNEYNRIFPETAYTIIGLSKDGNNNVRVVVEQPYINGVHKSLREWITEGGRKAADTYFKSKGFVKDDEGRYYNDDVYVFDVHNRNIVFKDGEPVVIDANIVSRVELQNEKNNLSYDSEAWKNIADALNLVRRSRLSADMTELKALVAKAEKNEYDALKKKVHYRVEEEHLPTVWLPKDEYAKLSGAIHTNGRYENGKVGSEFTDNNFYLYTYRGDGRFDVNMKLPIEGNEEIIDILRKGTENGTIESAADIASTFEASGHGSDWYNNNNASSERRRGDDVGFGRLSSLRQSHERRGDERVDTELSQSASAEHISKAIEKTARQTGGKVKQVHSVEEIENEQVRKDIEDGKEVTGWYDEKTGEVHLYMPNIHDSYTAEKTVWHETVGHRGMRGLLGDKFHTYLRSLWMDMDNPVFEELHKYVKERMAREPMSMYDAIEEFVAEAAEKGRGEAGFWNNIRNKVAEALRSVGYRLCPNVKDVKYMLWLAKNVQKHPNDPVWKMRAEAAKWKIDHEKTEYTTTEGGEIRSVDGKAHGFESMTKAEWDEATDGQVHYRTSPSAATATDRYERMLSKHGYMAIEAFADNMASVERLMRALDPKIKKIEDVSAAMNPYMLRTVLDGTASEKMQRFEADVMQPLDKYMARLIDAVDGKNDKEKIRNFNLYMIKKHGLERNRVFFVRDAVKNMDEKKRKQTLADFNQKRKDLGKQLRGGRLMLSQYYTQLDEWIRNNVNVDYKAGEHDYSGMHGMYGIDDKKSPYDDIQVQDEVMSAERAMEGMEQGSVEKFWGQLKVATQFSLDEDYKNGFVTKANHESVSEMFDWYVPLRKFDEATAEDVYGYVTELGDSKTAIGPAIVKAKGRKSLSETNILAQVGAMANYSVVRGSQNKQKQAFALFVRNKGGQGLVTETKAWVEKVGTDMNGNGIWQEVFPDIQEGDTADEIAKKMEAFEQDMKQKEAQGLAKNLTDRGDVGFKFERRTDKGQHFVDVMIAGKTHRFVINGNPRAAQALNGELENSAKTDKIRKTLKSVTRFMAQMATSYNPEFVMRNAVRDAGFALQNVTAKEGIRYAAIYKGYYLKMLPVGASKMSFGDVTDSAGWGLYAKYRNGKLDTNNETEKWFKEFMENGGETGFVQIKNMQQWEKQYKRDILSERSLTAKSAKAVKDFFIGNVECANEVVENMARFAAYCASRRVGRSIQRCAYDAKQVSVNFNRHGSGDAISSFMTPSMGKGKQMRRDIYGFLAGYFRNYSMFFNAGVQGTQLMFSNIKKAPVATIGTMMASPFAFGMAAAMVNAMLIGNEDEKERGGVKDPYAELPEYIRRNNLCIYLGKGKFVTIPLAIEHRAFYGLGDIVASLTTSPRLRNERNVAMDMMGCVSQLFPVVDFMNSEQFDKHPLLETGKGVLPTTLSPFAEWLMNSDWKGAPIRRVGDYTENRPSWKNAYSSTPERLIELNKWANAATNDVDPGNPNMKGNNLADAITDPSMLNHIVGTLGGGAITTTMRAENAIEKWRDTEWNEIPIGRNFMYTPNERTGMARTKARWYNYVDAANKTIANYDELGNKNVPVDERIANIAARFKFENTDEYRKVDIIKRTQKQLKRMRKLRSRSLDDKAVTDAIDEQMNLIIQDAVSRLEEVGK